MAVKAHAFKERGGKEGGGKGYLGKDELAFTISTHQDQSIIQFIPMAITEVGNANDRVSDTLTVGANHTTGRETDIALMILGEVTGEDRQLSMRILVRRLTPTECLRLQGFPDDYCKNVKGASDSKIYQVCGNSMTTNVMNWLGKRIDAVDSILREMGRY